MGGRRTPAGTQEERGMTDTKHLEESLSNLRREVDRLDIGDEQTRLRLGRLIADIERTIGAPAGAPPHDLGERLNASVLQFEASHPRIAVVMNELMKQLSNMGI
jgi:hypothetical protein